METLKFLGAMALIFLFGYAGGLILGQLMTFVVGLK